MATRVPSCGNDASSAGTWRCSREPQLRLAHQLFELHAARKPRAIAVVSGKRTLSYGELNRRANQLARYLLKLEAGPDAPVVISLERSADLVTVLLAALKAGAGFVTLDPRRDAEFAAFVCQDARPACIVTREALASGVPKQDKPVVLLDGHRRSIEWQSDRNPEGSEDDGGLAYLVYSPETAGSPAGVRVSRHALSNTLQAVAVLMGARPQERLLAVSPLGGDLFYLELLMPLIAGAAVVIAPDNADASEIGRLLLRYDITLMQATPGAWRALIAGRWSGKVDLRALCGGGTLSAELAIKLRRRCRAAWHVYGPLECAIWATAHAIQETAAAPALGKPLANTRAYILDRQLRPVPVGVPGELCLAGASLADGYPGRPELTEERFVPDPFAKDGLGRLFRTGDRARYAEDGSIVLCGLSAHLTKAEFAAVTELRRGEQEIKPAGTSPAPPVATRQLPEAARHVLLETWNDTARPHPQLAVHELFRSCARTQPGRVALQAGARLVSYAELDRLSDALAARLRTLGIGRGAAAGVLLKRTPEMVIAFLAVLKAGGAYLPLDEGLPASRLSFLIEDAGARVVITDKSLSATLPSGCMAVSVDEFDWTESAGAAVAGTETSLDDLAYIMYTSGSTGQPKGVEIRHRGIVRLLFGGGFAEFGPDEVFLQLAPPTFDASTLEIWGALLHGARCVLFPERVPTAAALGRIIREGGVSILWLTASLFNAIVDEDVSVLAPVRQLLIGGEALSAPHVRRALAALPSTRIINGYGPTESTTFAACYAIPHELPAGVTSIPIGKPIGNTRVYVLDAEGAPVPVGVAGELYIGGDGLARGYLNRPDLNRERFVADPFSPRGQKRLYRTGDLVRYLPGGELEFLGRLDDQVKIRGFRIEPGEIEGALLAHPAVRTASVAVRPNALGEKCLVGYVVPRESGGPLPDALREWLADRLPAYMVPTVFLKLDALPLTANGKVNRAALPGLEASRPESGREADRPRDACESQLIEIWEKVLGRGGIGIRDEFFALGGHSLLAARLASRIEEAFGVALPLAALFQAATVEQQAALIRGGVSSQTPWSVIPVQTGGSRPPFFCLGWKVPVWIADRLGEDQPCLGLMLEPADAAMLSVPYQLEEICALLGRSIAATTPRGPYYLGGFCQDAFFAYELARQLKSRGCQVPLVIMFDPPNPFPRPQRGARAGAAARIRLYAHRIARDCSVLRRTGFTRESRAYVTGRMEELKRKIKRFGWRTIYRAALALGKRPSLNVEAIFYLAGRNYQPKPFDGQIVIFRPAEKRNGGPPPVPGARRNWNELVAGVTVEEIPGDHASMLQDPNVEVLADRLNRHLLSSQPASERA